jgi:hypothetical protein
VHKTEAAGLDLAAMAIKKAIRTKLVKQFDIPPDNETMIQDMGTTVNKGAHRLMKVGEETLLGLEDADDNRDEVTIGWVSRQVDMEKIRKWPGQGSEDIGGRGEELKVGAPGVAQEEAGSNHNRAHIVRSFYVVIDFLTGKCED